MAGNGSDPLYQMGARAYAPHLGTFTQLDTYAGTAQDPISLNRYLYAHANPATLIDPSGHSVQQGPCGPDGQACDEGGYNPDGGPQFQNPNAPVIEPVAGGGGTSSTGGGDAGGADPPIDSGFDPWSAVTSIFGGAVDMGRAGWDTASTAVIGFANGTADIAACAVPIEGFGCSPAQLIEALIEDWDGTTGAMRNETAIAIGEYRSDLLSGDTYRVSRAVFSIFLVVGTIGRAGTRRTLVRDVPNPTGLLQNHIDDINNGFAQAPASWTTMLSRAEREALVADPYALGPRMYGNAIERSLMQRIAENAELQDFVDNRGPNRWDVNGRNQFEGLMFEVTTTRGVPKHADRWYGDMVEYITYDRPNNYLSWLGGD